MRDACLQRAIGREARIKHTPELSFSPDPAVRAGARIDELLTVLPEPTATVDPDLYVEGTPGVTPPETAETAETAEPPAAAAADSDAPEATES